MGKCGLRGRGLQREVAGHGVYKRAGAEVELAALGVGQGDRGEVGEVRLHGEQMNGEGQWLGKQVLRAWREGKIVWNSMESSGKNSESTGVS